MSLGNCHLSYLLRTCDIEDLGEMIKGYTKMINYHKGLIKARISINVHAYLVNQQECLREITERALKIKQSEVENERV